jgi:hypothetical protein
VRSFFGHCEFFLVLHAYLTSRFSQVAATLTVPFDVIKTHRQIELGKEEFLHSKLCAHLTFRAWNVFICRENRAPLHVDSFAPIVSPARTLVSLCR